MDCQNFQKSNLVGGKLLIIWLSINLPSGHVRSHKQFGPDRLTVLPFKGQKQTNRQTDRQAKLKDTNKQTDRPRSKVYI